ncbi:MAG: FtsQ-type POTRA domain-containing protein [Victivallaceae bacterium]|nr:FtsQ-type POTRA domain-containing protein [Victivallaceae bacterium]
MAAPPIKTKSLPVNKPVPKIDNRSFREKFADWLTPQRRELIKMLSFATLAVVIICCLIWAFLTLRDGMFTGNRRMVLQDIRVVSSEIGYWKKPETQQHLCSIIGVTLDGSTNMFTSDGGRVRAKLLQTPSSRDAAVKLEIPGRLVIEIEERVPRAMLRKPKAAGKYGNLRIIDEDIVTIPGQQAQKRTGLPYITEGPGYAKLQKKEQMSEIRKAMDIIMLIEDKTFPNFKILNVIIESSVANRHEMIVELSYFNEEKDCLTIDASDDEFGKDNARNLLNDYQTAVNRARREQRNSHDFDLRTPGRVILGPDHFVPVEKHTKPKPNVRKTEKRKVRK